MVWDKCAGLGCYAKGFNLIDFGPLDLYQFFATVGAHYILEAYS